MRAFLSAPQFNRVAHIVMRYIGVSGFDDMAGAQRIMGNTIDDPNSAAFADDGRIETRNLLIGGEQVTLRIEKSYWRALEEVCRREGMTALELIGDIRHRLQEQSINSKRGKDDASPLNAAVRVFIVGYFRKAATETGHQLAGHGGGWIFSKPQETGAPCR